MEILAYETLPFPGWPAFRAAFSRLNAGAVMRFLVAHAWRQMQEPRRRFVGDELVHVTNFVPLLRVAARTWLDQGAAPIASVPSLPDLVLLTRLARQMSDEAQRTLIEGDGPRLTSAKHVHRRACRTMIVSALQMRARNRGTGHELGRTWELLRRLWDERRYDVMDREAQRKGEAPPRLPLSTGFDSLEVDLFFAIFAWRNAGWIQDPSTYLQRTELAVSLNPTVTERVPAIDEVVGDWAKIERETPSSLRNPFFEHPVVRLPTGALIFPDPGAALGALQDRALRGATIARDNRSLTLAGYVYESYVARLVEECGRYSADERYHSDLGGGKGDEDDQGSPDAFLIAAHHALAFEVKVSRPAEPPDDVASLPGFLDLMEKATGRRERKNGTVRPALEQGRTFMDRWRDGDAGLIGRLGALPRAWGYVVVVPWDWPACTHWGRFRRTAWLPRLAPTEAVFDRSVVYLCHVDLEAAVMVLRARAERGQPSALGLLLKEWHDDWTDQHPVRQIGEKTGVTRGSLADFLHSRHPLELTGSIEFLDGALEKLADAVGGLAFTQGEVRVAQERRRRERQ